jgi:hypothetical protein
MVDGYVRLYLDAARPARRVPLPAGGAPRLAGESAGAAVAL